MCPALQCTHPPVPAINLSGPCAGRVRRYCRDAPRWGRGAAGQLARLASTDRRIHVASLAMSGLPCLSSAASTRPARPVPLVDRPLTTCGGGGSTRGPVPPDRPGGLHPPDRAGSVTWSSANAVRWDHRREQRHSCSARAAGLLNWRSPFRATRTRARHHCAVTRQLSPAPHGWPPSV
jgi:hypothetical protein